MSDELSEVDINVPELETHEYSDIIECCLELFYDYYTNNIHNIKYPDFHDCMNESVSELLMLTIEDLYLYDYEIDEIHDIVLTCEKIFYTSYYDFVKRCDGSTFPTTVDKNHVKKQLSYLRKLYQPEQRTTDWYKYRYNLITASNAYKAIDNESNKNSIILEKCKPLVIHDDNDKMVNVESPLHWGQKYEPLSVIIYESLYNTTIEDFGCIQHNNYTFIGASPDGINSDPKSSRYGRMLEIKNIVNREIDGIPKLEYWVQMQLQMEVCNLNECDFLETRFIEFDNENDFYQDQDKEENSNHTELDYHVILYFHNNITNKPLYIYKPLDVCTKKSIQEWECKLMDDKTNEGLIWIRNIYVKLDQLSCVLVQRNKLWFNSIVSEMTEVWNTIEYEREHGTPEYRLKNKRQSIKDVICKSECLIKINKIDDDEISDSITNNTFIDIDIPVVDTITIKDRKMSI